MIKPNLQRVKVIDDKGTVKRVWVSARMIKAGKVQKVLEKMKLAARVIIPRQIMAISRMTP